MRDPRGYILDVFRQGEQFFAEMQGRAARHQARAAAEEGGELADEVRALNAYAGHGEIDTHCM